MKNKICLRSISFLLLLIISSSFSVFSQQVETVEVYSPKMDIKIQNVIITPDGYEQSDKLYPVVYLLHGYSGNHLSWLSSVRSDLPALSTKYQMIIVCPDGKNSWYWDSPINPKSQFETYVSKELVEYMDKNYKTIKSKKGRAITGFSMGGHGALWLTIQHPEVFGAAGSMSGGVDIRPFPKNWEMSKALGSYEKNRERWDEYTVINKIEKLGIYKTPLIIDCGQDDFFIDVNENLHKLLLAKKIQHTYIMPSGEHNAEYWHKVVDWHLDFFDKYFNPTK